LNRTEFIVATAIVLFLAFLFGWFMNWLVHRFARIQQSEMDEVDKMAQQLHEAEEARDDAIAWYQHREAQLTNQLAQTEAELRAAMDGLREARTDAEELRAHVERMSSAG
jgi:prophage endopeptidase